MNRSMIKIRNMSFSYKDKVIFNDFNLDIKEGSFVSLIGRNASGKSTLSKILVGLLKYIGYININGFLLNNENIKEIRRYISLCNDDLDSYFIGETIKDDLAFSLENLEYSKKEMDDTIKNISSIFKIDDILEKVPSDLSNSDKVKCIIASSLIHNPKILILDEILEYLNPVDKKLVFKILKDYQKKKGLTIISITHNLEDTLLSDRIIVLDNGKIIKDDTKENIYSDESLEKLGFSLPFVVKLSHNLILYDILDKVYFDMGKMVDEIWE